MNVQRGDVVLLDYPYASGGGAKVRPALVVQNDRDNQRLTNTIVVQNTSVTRRALEPTQLLVEVSTLEGQLSGLRQDSVVNCVNIVTLEKSKVLRRLGTLPDSLLPAGQRVPAGGFGLGAVEPPGDDVRASAEDQARTYKGLDCAAAEGDGAAG